MTKVEKDIGQDAQIKTYKDLLSQQQETISFADNPEKQQNAMEDKAAGSKFDAISSKSSKDPAYGRKLTNLMNRNIQGDIANDFENFSDMKLNITISVRTLENLKSISLDDPSADDTIENFAPEKTQSLFWFEFNFFGNKFSTKDTKTPHSKTVKQDKDDLFNLDFSFTENRSFDLTADLYKNVMKGFVVEVHHSEPLKVEPVEGEEEDVEPQFHVKEELLGFVIVSMDEFINNNSMTTLRRKYPLFDEKDLLRHPNAYFPMKDEKSMIEKGGEEIDKIRKAREPVVSDNEATVTSKTDKKKDVKKPDPKKKDPKAKDAAKVEEAHTVAQLNWTEDPRNIIVTKGDYLGRKDFKNDKKFYVASKPVLAVQVSFS